MKTIGELLDRLQELRERTNETPLFNPVFQLSLDLSRLLESGERSLEDFESWISELECDALQSRAAQLRRLVQPVKSEENSSGFTAMLAEETDDLAMFRQRWEHPQLHAVFTAHPTFLLTPQESETVATNAAMGGDIDESACPVPGKRPAVTLRYEHDRAMQAIAQAADARDRLVTLLLEKAQTSWPEGWHEFSPMPFRFASWVGYDMDGRTDIKWFDSIGFRLSEKAQRLQRYLTSLEKIDSDHPLLRELRPAIDYAQERAQDFSADLSDPAAHIQNMA